MRLYRKAILPQGFLASAVACGIKKSGKLDLALFYSQVPAKAACLFTANKIKAAPIILSKKHLKQSKYHQAIIANSGIANCFTGNSGLIDAKNTARYLAKELSIKRQSVLVASTGIIGRDLPTSKIKKAIPKLVGRLSRQGIDEAKRAILTTDTVTKEITLKYSSGNKIITICALSKGAGMIAPQLATMLVFILTDANIASGALERALKIAVDTSFNCLTIDGCMSTNDTVAILANGMAGNSLIESGQSFHFFAEGLKTVCTEAAKLIAKDAEGASKFIQIKVSKAKNFLQARITALAIANSNLFKSAIYGENPNFGRIAAAVGSSGITLKERDLKIKVSPLKKKDIFVDVSLNQGKASATVYTADLTPEYIKINAEYN